MSDKNETESTGVGPAGVEPTGVEPTGVEPTEIESTNVESTREEPALNESSGSCGALLAAARHTKDFSVQEVAARLCLSVSRIEALETDNYSSLPEATFTRGYIKSYAQLVELDTDMVLSFFPTSASSGDNSPKMVIVPAEPLVKEGAGGPKLFIIFISIAMIAYIVWYLQQQSSVQVEPESRSSIQTEPGQSAALSTSQNTSMDGARSVQGIQLAEQSSAGISSISAESVSDVDKVEVGNSDIAAATPLTTVSEVTSPASVFTSPTNSPEGDTFRFGLNNLKVSCSSAVWLDIRNNTGEKLFYRTCAGGEDIAFSIDLPAAVFVGSIDGIELILDDKAVDLSSYSNGLSYARFTLNSWSGNGSQFTVPAVPQAR